MTPSNNGPVRGVIFDMDGTLVDNMSVHDDAWEAWHAEHGLAFDRPAFFRDTAGRAITEIVGPLFPHLDAEAVKRLGDDKERLYRELYEPRLAPMPGLPVLLDALDAAGIAMSVGTAAPLDNIAMVLGGLGIHTRFRTVVSPALGLRGKPHPDMFLEAAARMALEPADVIVFEDAPLGIEAARRAGMRAVAVLSTLPAEAFAADNIVAYVKDFRDPALRPILGLTA